MKIAENITDLIGRTPLIHLGKFSEECGANLFAKLEYQNPGGSVKDRLAWAMIQDAEEKGLINRNTVIIEPTSGNTGIGLAMVCAARGYRLVITMPEATSIERRLLIKAYGAELVLTEADKGMQGSIDKAIELSHNYEHSFIPYQFRNKANVEMHRRTTGPEIWHDMDGKLDIFIAGMGTGGTVTGTGEYLKSKNNAINVVGVEPAGSPVVSGGKPGKHRIAGIGPGFIPEVLNVNILDEVIMVTDEDATTLARRLTREAGVFSGISSGAILWAAMEIGRRTENQGKNIVLITCDTGERYLSTSLYAAE
ncbi:MAG: cysteine synthase A [Bacteroidales bacterium]|nr:cysteine synthase A [Bacteroidales bacterium]